MSTFKHKIAIITGSTLGGAEYVAEHLQQVMAKQNIASDLFHGPNLEQVINYSIWLVVTSTHGAGELPDNLKPLIAEIQQKNTALTQLNFAVVGLGSSDYDTFCFAVNHIEQSLSAQGAVQLCASHRMDVVNVVDQDQSAEDWLPHFLAKLCDLSCG